MLKRLKNCYSLAVIAGLTFLMHGVAFAAPPPIVSISITPTTGTLNPSQTESLTASVTGSMNTSVSWTLSPSVGTLGVSGNTAIYTAPATVTMIQQVLITVTSATNTTVKASSTIILAPSLKITPLSATLTNSQSVTFTTSGANTGGVVWSVSPAVGTLVQKGTTAVYTVPSSLSGNQAVAVEAISVSNSTLIARAALLLVPTVAIALAPPSADLMTGGQMVLTPTVTGSTNTGINWSLSPNVGMIDNTGLYTAPSSLRQDTAVTVTAIAQADTTKSASSQIRVHANEIYFTTNANGLQSVVWNGTNYNNPTNDNLFAYVQMQSPSGVLSGLSVPSCTGSFTTTSVTKSCQVGGDSLGLTVSYSVPSNGTLQAQVSLTNNSRTNTVHSAGISTLAVQMSQFDPVNSVLTDVNEKNVLSIVSFVTGRFAIWTDTPGPNVSTSQQCGWSYICKDAPILTNIAPSQTLTAKFSVRFTSNMTEDRVILAPEAYSEYQAAHPYLVNWPDRRPISLWFMSDYGHQSATNPRGYFNQPALDVSNISAFQSTALAQAQNIIASIQARPVKPQGIILWDIEGQEFPQATSYVGDPRIFSEGYDAEMNATADQLFALFKNAGLKVGVTIRPEYLQWGPVANLPSTCNSNSEDNYKDYYIATGAPLHQKFYACSAPNTWLLMPSGNGSQTMFQSTQVQQVINLLLSKVAYARARWGTMIYYVDSAVWDGGAPITATIFRALQQAYPDSLFIPEQSYIGTMGVTIPYAAPNGSLNSLYAPETWRFAYPNGAQATNLSNCNGTCWAADAPSFDIGQKIGDIAMYSIPGQLSTPQLTAIETMILQARKEAGTVNVTDISTGAIYSYNGTPSTIYSYPVKMMVYFAVSVSDLTSSSTYCENGAWLGTNSCTLNLAGLTVAQIRYYDFEGNLVSSAAAGPR
jgi:hypothetical protein